MLKTQGLRYLAVLIAVSASATFFVENAWSKDTERVIYSFTGGSDGANPYSDLIQDKKGNLYGTAEAGANPGCVIGNSCGTVFKLTLNGEESVLHSFSGSDGGNPYAGLTIDKKGNLYGDTLYGGEETGDGNGVLFMLSPELTYTTLHAFTGNTDGGNPRSVLISDKRGNLYGTALYGGRNGFGLVFKLTPSGALKDLYDFMNGDDGATPAAGLVIDSKGNLYGTTQGASGYGTIFKLKPNGKLITLHMFVDSPGGIFPSAALVMDKKGNLYGTTVEGGQQGGGIVFEITKNEKFKTLYNFSYGNDGGDPYGKLTIDANDNIYGTTSHGGVNDNGVVFKLATDGKETVLHNFKGGRDGANPYAGLLLDNDGNLYGATTKGGVNDAGTVFTLKID